MLSTPPATSSCLPGITRDTVIRIARGMGYEVREADVVRSNLYHADEVFFTGTAAEITPIRSVDDHEIGAGPDHEAHPERVLRDHDRPLGALARVPRLPRHDARQGVKVEAARQIPLSRPDVGPLEEEYVLAALRSGVLGLGPYARNFEKEFAAFCGCEHAVAVSSGTAGLHLLVRAAGIGAGDEVVTAPISFVASANVMLYERATPSSPMSIPTRSCSTRRPSRRRSRRARAGSCPCTCSATRATWRRSARSPSKHGLAIIEDACEAVGSVRSGRRVGGSGTPAVFAFYPNKQMTTGEGGMVTTDDPALAAQVRSLANQGRSDTGDWLEHDRLGFNYRMDELSAAVGLAQTERLEEILAARAEVAARYDALLGTIDGVTIPAPTAPGDVRSWFVYVVRLDAAIDRDARDGGACRRAAWPASRTCPPCTCSRSTAASGTGRASSPSPRRSRARRSRCRSTRGSRRRSGLRRRLPRRRARLSDARCAPATGRPRDVGRELPRRAGRRPPRHGLAGVPRRARDLARRRRAPARRPPRDREPRRARACRSSTTAAARIQQPCDTVAAPFAGADTVLYAVADGEHANLASASLQRRPSRLVAQMAQPAGGAPPPYTLAGPEAVWYTASALRARPPDISAPARTLIDAPTGGPVRAVARREPVTAWLGAHRRRAGRALRAARRRARRDALHARPGRACA